MRLVFCGNCQTHALHFAYNLFVVPHTGDETAYIYHQHMDQPRTRALAAAAEVIVDQILPHDHRQPLPDANPAALRIQVPSVGGTFLWPYAGVSHPDGFRRYKNYHPFRAPFKTFDTKLVGISTNMQGL